MCSCRHLDGVQGLGRGASARGCPSSDHTRWPGLATACKAKAVHRADGARLLKSAVMVFPVWLRSRRAFVACSRLDILRFFIHPFKLLCRSVNRFGARHDHLTFAQEAMKCDGLGYEGRRRRNGRCSKDEWGDRWRRTLNAKRDVNTMEGFHIASACGNSPATRRIGLLFVMRQ